MNKRGKHQTVHRDARRAIAWFDAQPEVEKVLLGVFHAVTSRSGFRRIGAVAFRMEVPAGLRVQVMTGVGILDVVVTLAREDRPALLERLAQRWPQYADRIHDPRRRATTTAA